MKYLIVCLLLPSQLGFAQGLQLDLSDPLFYMDQPYQPEEVVDPGTEFMFVRGEYSNYLLGQLTGTGEWWKTDHPAADRNFVKGLMRYTSLDIQEDSYTSVGLASEELFNYPFLYINMKRTPIDVKMSGPDLSKAEAANLREYMLRGGFVLVDDLWGDLYWNESLLELTKIFPDRELVKLYANDPIFHIFYDVNKVLQVPGRPYVWGGGYDYPGYDPAYPPSVHAVKDDQGRIMMIVQHNMDMGDGWEHTYHKGYPTEMTNTAYQMAINYIMYALSR